MYIDRMALVNPSLVMQVASLFLSNFLERVNAPNESGHHGERRCTVTQIFTGLVLSLQDAA